MGDQHLRNHFQACISQLASTVKDGRQPESADRMGVGVDNCNSRAECLCRVDIGSVPVGCSPVRDGGRHSAVPLDGRVGRRQSWGSGWK